MKRGLLFFAKLTLGFLIVFFGLYSLYKNSVKENIRSNFEMVNQDWAKIMQLQEVKNIHLRQLLDSTSKNIKFIDSLYFELSTSNKRKSLPDSNYVYKQYLSNKYMLPTLRFYIQAKDSNNANNVKLFKKVEIDIENLNTAVANYDSSVRTYNHYIGTFPNSVFAISDGYKMQNYFELQYGSENKDPKVALKERRAWQRKLEIEHGL